MIQINKNLTLSSKKQKGATLFTAMMFIVLMTTVGVSSSKLAIMDIMVASNDHKQMQIYQETANKLRKLATVTELAPPISNKIEGDFNDNDEYIVPPDSLNPLTNRVIRRVDKYDCKGFDGEAVTFGTPCMLYEFEVKEAIADSGVRDRHIRGAGKEVPDTNNNNY